MNERSLDILRENLVDHIRSLELQGGSEEEIQRLREQIEEVEERKHALSGAEWY